MRTAIVAALLTAAGCAALVPFTSDPIDTASTTKAGKPQPTWTYDPPLILPGPMPR